MYAWKTLRLFCLLLLLLPAFLPLTGCAPAAFDANVVPPEAVGEVAGFWKGLWHGFILLFTFIVWRAMRIGALAEKGGEENRFAVYTAYGCGLWIGFKCLTDTIESSGSVYVFASDGQTWWEEEKLLHAIFGRAGEDVKNDSLEVPSGTEGIVIDAQKFSRKISQYAIPVYARFRRPELEAKLEALRERLSPDLPLPGSGASTVGLSNLRAFLEALTDPAALERARQAPERVPSGLTVGGG